MTAPVSHIDQAHKVEMERIVDLFQITLKKTGTIVRFCNRPTITWQSNVYNFWNCALTGDGANSEGKAIRPQLVIGNPEGFLSPLADQGEFDLALLIRRQVRQDHLLADTNIFRQSVWFISHPSMVDRTSISFECHQASDVPNFAVPPNFFAPPEFPFVVY